MRFPHLKQQTLITLTSLAACCSCSLLASSDAALGGGQPDDVLEVAAAGNPTTPEVQSAAPPGPAAAPSPEASQPAVAGSSTRGGSSANPPSFEQPPIGEVGGASATSAAGAGGALPDGSVEVLSCVAEQGHTVRLECPPGMVIGAFEGAFGTLDDPAKTVSCGSCVLGESRCEVHFSVSTCGDPDPGCGKHGRLEITCQ